MPGSRRLPGAMRIPSSVSDLRHRPAHHGHRAAPRHGPRRKIRPTDTSPTRLRRSVPPALRRGPPRGEPGGLPRSAGCAATAALHSGPGGVRGRPERCPETEKAGGRKTNQQQNNSLTSLHPPPPEQPAGAQCSGPPQRTDRPVLPPSR